MTASYDARVSRFDEWNQRVIDEFRANAGAVGDFGRSLVLLHHTGARSGTERVTPVRGIRADPDTWWIAASKAGMPENPAWFHNLLAHPDVVIETPDDGDVPVHAVVLPRAERDAAWEQFKAASEGFASYEQRTTRVIPVVALHRR